MKKQHKREYSHQGIELLEETSNKHKKEVVNVCPECANQVFFLEAGFLCPTCGYSMETVYN